MRPNVRIYSEREYPLGPPSDNLYEQLPDGTVIQKPRDTRMWVSYEWLEEHGEAER